MDPSQCGASTWPCVPRRTVHRRAFTPLLLLLLMTSLSPLPACSCTCEDPPEREEEQEETYSACEKTALTSRLQTIRLPHRVAELARVVADLRADRAAAPRPPSRPLRRTGPPLLLGVDRRGVRRRHERVHPRRLGRECPRRRVGRPQVGPDTDRRRRRRRPLPREFTVALF